MFPLKSFIMPAVMAVILYCVLPFAGVHGDAVYGFAVAVAAWAWISGRINYAVGNYCKRAECVGLFLTLACVFITGFAGTLLVLGWLASSFPDAGLNPDSGVPLAFLVLIASNVLRITVNAVWRDQPTR